MAKIKGLLRKICHKILGKRPVTKDAFLVEVVHQNAVLDELRATLSELKASTSVIQNHVIRLHDAIPATIMPELDQIHARTTRLVENDMDSRRSLYADLARGLHRSIAEMESLVDSDPVRVVFITDGNYLQATTVAITSLLRHRRCDVKVEVNVIGVGLSDSEAAKFNVFGSAVNLVKVANRYADRFARHRHVSEAALLKFDLPSLFLDYDKILYLDGDLLILDDLGELWRTPLEDCCAAVVKDYAAYLNGAHPQRIGHKDYFNSGVMLLNLDLFRRVGMSERLLEIKNNDPVPGAFMDQTAFNVAFDENVKYVSPKFNMMRCNNRRWAPSIHHISHFYDLSVKDFAAMSEFPVVLHLTNIMKPWSSRSAPGWEQWQDEANVLQAMEELMAKEIPCVISST